uniref:Si:ch211-57n23.1 n=1 Tax=Amphiprion percula TaxID=161767 RepID=A0A3P8SVW5_AMPPE
SCCLLLAVCSPADDAGSAGSLPLEQVSGEPDVEDLEWGSGSSILHLLHSFPADSPFITETPEKPVNCTQRFWLPPSTPICWENIAGPEEFAKSRLLVLQNRAALQAVSTSSGVEEGGVSYDYQAREEVQGIRSEHQKMVETMQTMETVFVGLAEKRKEGKDMKEHLANTRDAIEGREHMANHLEKQFSTLEKNLLNMQLRLSKFIRQ